MDALQESGLEFGHRVALFAMSLALLGLVLELVRRGLLKERYALLWLATAAFGLIIGLFPSLIVRIASLFRFQMITLLFVLSFVFTLGIVLIFSVIISRLSERNRALAQEVALLENRMRNLEDNDNDA